MARRRALLVVVAVLSFSGGKLCAQPLKQVEYQVYQCRWKPAVEITRMLAEIMPSADFQSVANPQTGELLLRGPEEAIRQALAFIKTVDVDNQQAAKPEKTKVRAYPCPVSRQAETVRALRQKYAANTEVRVTADGATNKLFVLATGAVHDDVESWLQQSERSHHVDPPLSKPRPLGLLPKIFDQRPPSEMTLTTRFVPLRGDLDQIQRRILPMFKDRLYLVEDASRESYQIGVALGRRLSIAFDRRRGGIDVSGARPVVDQFARLVLALDGSGKDPRRRTAVLSVQRTHREALEQALDAHDEPPAQSSDADQSRAATPGARPVRFVHYQPEGPTAPAGAVPQSSGDETPAALRDRAIDVDVDILPELDVIIVRGLEGDVRQFTEIIAQLERLSEQTQPQVRIIRLLHSRSESVLAVVNEVSDDLVGRRQGRVSVTALVKPNGLLLVGWGDAVAAVEELIEKLDRPVSPESQFSVFRIRHAPVSAVEQSVQQFFTDRQGLGTVVQTVGDVRTNTLIVYAAPRDMAEVARLVESLDIPGSGTLNQARVIQLHNAIAAELAATLQTAIEAARGGTATARSAALELLTIDAEGERLVRSGVLTDVHITPDPRNNTIIVSGPPESMALVTALVEQMDTRGAVAQIKVFRIINGDAGSLIQMLRSLLPSQAPTAIGPQIPSAEGETSLAPLRFSVDLRTNSIIATGSDGDLRIIEALLLRLDQNDATLRTNEVYHLKNAPALDVARAINSFLRSERQLEQAAPGIISPFEQIEKEVVVVPEPVGNTLIISATARYFDQIRDLVEKLDEQPPEVMIQVLIAEVELNNVDEFGVELGVQDSVLFDRSLLGNLITTISTAQQSTPAGIITATEEVIRAATNQPGFNFNNGEPLGNSGSRQALDGSNHLAGQGLTNFSVGRVNSELQYGGLVLSAGNESINVLIRALQETRRMDILSRPQIRTLDNQPAFIQVGERVPRIVGSTVNEAGQSNSVVLENVGLILGVTPRISPEGMVVMEIDAEKSELGPEADGIPISVSVDGTVIRSPRIETTTAQATISAASGETIILGGLITKNQREVQRRVPFLSDIPLLGNLFRYDGYSAQRSELLIILTPRVIRSPEDAELIKQMEIARMSWCAADVYEMHGDIGFSVHENAPWDGPQTEVIFPDATPRGSPPPEPGHFDQSRGAGPIFPGPLPGNPPRVGPPWSPPTGVAPVNWQPPLQPAPSASRQQALAPNPLPPVQGASPPWTSWPR